MTNKMRVLVLGASGRTGRIIVCKLLQHGFAVTAFVRTLQKLECIQHSNLLVIQGDIRNNSSMDEAIKTCDVVISALGKITLTRHSVISDAVAALIGLMKLYGKRRLIFISSLGVGDSKGQLGLIYNLVYLPTFLRNVFRDKERQEKLIHESDLDWTIIRPAHFLPFPLPLRYRECVMPARPRIFPVISRLHTAGCIVQECDENRYIRKNIALSYF